MVILRVLLYAGFITWVIFSPARGAQPESLFERTGEYDVGDAPGSLCAADFDHDGDADLATVNFFSNNVSVLLNNGEGSFPGDVKYAVGEYPMSVLADDFDGDGDVDLAVANWKQSYAGDVSILLNRGDGTFADTLNYGGGLVNGPLSLFAADLDGDGDVDLAAGRDTEVQILWNDGHGAFTQYISLDARVRYGMGFYVRLTSICGGDFDGDGDVDIVASHGMMGPIISDTIVYLFFNEGSRNFSRVFMRHEGVGDYDYNGILAADVDSDGNIDLVQVLSGAPSVFVFLNRGDGSFSDPLSYDVRGSWPNSVYGADFDADGDIDLVTANFKSDDISVLLNRGDGSFAEAVIYEAGGGPAAVQGADLDSDGDIDLVVSNAYSDNVSIFLNTTKGDIPTEIGVGGSIARLQVPETYILYQNYPNPFNKQTNITFDLSGSGEVVLWIYNIKGQQIRKLVLDAEDPGRYSVMWDGEDESGFPVPSGVYLYRLRAEGLAQTKRMIMIR